MGTKQVRMKGLTRKTLVAMRSLAPNFTVQHVVHHTGQTLEQASKTCSYLKQKGYLKVIGSAKVEGSKQSMSLFAPTEAYTKLLTEQPNLFSPTPNLNLVKFEGKKEKGTSLEDEVRQLRLCVRTVTEQSLEVCKIVLRALTTAVRVESHLEDLTKVQEVLQLGLEVWSKK